ncbi:hypothetical protein [Psychrobacillus lasiicapitis]|uniref:Uncharacterized protein n=1 Tax=Psychrobacillus lasiicapitis TaxID=1636719 RepID=A0A544T4U6_9BACI|nr:hypothetical protein [Psychrobacillus lasiicapitis]TQR12468.1 hypothetical protein FG382_12635 [Psychrobacillus lasiicapitis]GGA38348.1 hypothetical protein GCM10011384_29870 [Psychrobacillus lasiicapitis]
MSDLTGNEQEILLKNLMRRLMKEQLDELKEEKKRSNNSFLFLENNTLNMLITYLVMNQTNRKDVAMVDDSNKPSQEKILQELDHIIADNQQQFEEIITILKEKL